MISARRPRRTYVVRQRGVTMPVYRATREAWRACLKRERLDVREMDEAAHVALGDLWRLVDSYWLVEAENSLR
jgi:hypothetical protein